MQETEKKPEYKNPDKDLKTEETESERRAAEIISRIKFGKCKNKNCLSPDTEWPQKYLDEHNGLCPDCDKKTNTAAAEELRPVVQSTDIKIKKRSRYRMPYDGKLAASGQ